MRLEGFGFTDEAKTPHVFIDFPTLHSLYLDRCYFRWDTPDAGSLPFVAFLTSSTPYTLKEFSYSRGDISIGMIEDLGRMTGGTLETLSFWDNWNFNDAFYGLYLAQGHFSQLINFSYTHTLEFLTWYEEDGRSRNPDSSIQATAERQLRSVLNGALRSRDSSRLRTKMAFVFPTSLDWPGLWNLKTFTITGSIYGQQR